MRFVEQPVGLLGAEPLRSINIFLGAASLKILSVLGHKLLERGVDISQ
jgi:hypothetical protein